MKNTKLELNVQENFSEQLNLKQQLKMHFLIEMEEYSYFKGSKKL